MRWLGCSEHKFYTRFLNYYHRNSGFGKFTYEKKIRQKIICLAHTMNFMSSTPIQQNIYIIHIVENQYTALLENRRIVLDSELLINAPNNN